MDVDCCLFDYQRVLPIQTGRSTSEIELQADGAGKEPEL